MFFRGHTPAKIAAIAFSKHDNYIACISSKGTLHIFNLATSEQTGIAKNLLKGKIAGFGGLFGSYFESENRFAFAKGTHYKKSELLDESRDYFFAKSCLV